MLGLRHREKDEAIREKGKTEGKPAGQLLRVQGSG